MEVVKMESRIRGTFFQGIEMKPKSQSWFSFFMPYFSCMCLY